MADANEEGLLPKLSEVPLLQCKDEDPKTAATNDTFTLFPDLPIELRLKIWNNTLSERRFLRLGIYNLARQGAMPWTITSAREAHVALSVCKESREEALRLYKPLYPAVIRGLTVEYINPERDVLIFPGTKWALENHVINVLSSISGQGVHFKSLAVRCHFSTCWEHLWEALPVTGLSEVEELMVAMPYSRVGGDINGFGEIDREKGIAMEQGTPFIIGYDEVCQMFRVGFEKIQSKHPEWKAPRVRLGMFLFIL